MPYVYRRTARSPPPRRRHSRRYEDDERPRRRYHERPARYVERPRRRHRLPNAHDKYRATEVQTGVRWGPGTGTALKAWMKKALVQVGSAGLTRGYSRAGIPLSFVIENASGLNGIITVKLEGEPNTVVRASGTSMVATQ